MIDRQAGVPLCRFVSFADSLFLKFKARPEFEEHNVKNILLVKFWGLGNVVLASPAILAIRKKYPAAKIDFLTLEENKSLAESLNCIDNCVSIKLNGFFNFFKDFILLIFRLRKSNYDLVVDFEQFARSSALLAYFSGAKYRVGFDTDLQSRGGLYSIPVKYNNDQHIVETFFDLALAINCSKEKLVLAKVSSSTEDKSAVDVFLKEFSGKKLVCIHAGTGPNATTRRWPVKNYVKLIELLIKKYGVFVLLSGGQSEFLNTDKISSSISKDCANNCRNICGKFSIPQLAYLFERLSLFISSDTGPLHLAAAQKVNTLSFYGPNTPKIYGPWGEKNKNVVMYKNLSCSPCMSNYNDKLSECIHKEPYCITNISPEEVLEQIALKRLL